jgi:putative phosphoribosyl transferase
MPDTVVAVGDARLPGDLVVPADAVALVLFAHGSGSSHRSVRNRSVAAALNDLGLATLLFDLLEPAEADDRRLGFDIRLLADRLLGVTAWARDQDPLLALPIGYFGASTGAGAALLAAADEPELPFALVSRGGRPDLVPVEALDRVRAPTLLVVGGRDDVVLELNRQVDRELRCTHRLEVVPGATHLFEEPGALEQVTRLAGEWFTRHLHASGFDALPPSAST